ncbi:MAG: L-aspartate oxidase [Algibacter sp.]
MINTNYLVIGSGIAGLTFAVKIAEKFPERKVVIVTKSTEEESNTKYAQGGVSIVLDQDKDSFEKHIKDTLIAGDGLCNEAVVKMVVEKGPARLKELLLWGANFDKDANGNFDLGKEGGHSAYRIVHHKDITGYEIERTLLEQVRRLPNIDMLPHHYAIDLITDHHLKDSKATNKTCYGAYVLDQKLNKTITIKSDATLLASGGIGRVYGHTTNPTVATGDGIAMAYRAKTRISDMEFIQFHPTALYDVRGGRSSFLISEAVRGYGAYLRNQKGYRFMPDYDDRAELASRDIVSQSIDNELKKYGETHVFLDCTHLEIEGFKAHFPNIYKHCLDNHINIETDWIPVVPASHYLCGGIDVDMDGKTSIENLFACGECTKTGLHGANRLASNSLLEAMVYSHEIFKYHCENPLKTSKLNIPKWNDEGTVIPEEHIIIQHNLKELQALMRDYVGIVRSDNRLISAKKRLDLIYTEVEDFYKTSKITTSLCELRNMVNVAYLIITQSMARKENKGGFFNRDHVKNKA